MIDIFDEVAVIGGIGACQAVGHAWTVQDRRPTTPRLFISACSCLDFCNLLVQRRGRLVITLGVRGLVWL